MLDPAHPSLRGTATCTAPLPGAVGLYDSRYEHDSCGIALVAKLWGEATHAVVEKALEALEHMEHRGAEGADPNTGDGAGILLQIPDSFIRGAVAGVELPPVGRYGVGVCYLPREPERRAELEQLIEDTVAGRRPARDLVARRARRRPATSARSPGWRRR